VLPGRTAVAISGNEIHNQPSSSNTTTVFAKELYATLANLAERFTSHIFYFYPQRSKSGDQKMPQSPQEARAVDSIPQRLANPRGSHTGTAITAAAHPAVPAVPLAAGQWRLRLASTISLPMLFDGYNVKMSSIATRKVYDDMLEFAAHHSVKPTVETFALSESGFETALKS
jgi:hypothetical protein